jgi:hypothetical protein
MLTFRQLDDVGDAIVRLMAETEQVIINDMARRLGRLGELSTDMGWFALRQEIAGTVHQTILAELASAFSITERRLVELFDEAATRAIEFDNRVIRSAGLNPTPLAENPQMQQLVRAELIKTQGSLQNLTLTTAHTASMQFHRTLDLAHQLVTARGYSYEQAIRMGVRSLARTGIEAIKYPTGLLDEFGNPLFRLDHLDVAFRRALLTGINQTAAQLQLMNLEQMGVDLVETTAHPGARPTHIPWQGEVFSISGTHPIYRHFESATEYNTGPGLCGWNCRHSFFPFFDGLSEPAYTAEKLREYNEKMVMFNGEEMSLYDATQRQRYIERQIRRWKREADAYDAAGLDSSHARSRVSYWQAAQRDFVGQTELTRDYFRERAGSQNLQNTPVSGIITLDQRGREAFARMDYDDVKDMRVSNLAARQWYDNHVVSIPNQIDRSLPLEQQARQAHGLRNDYRTQARNIMSDTQTRDQLNRDFPHRTFDDLFQRNTTTRGMTASEAYEDIIRSAATPDKATNEAAGVR